jgi:hypothetical protein
VPWGVAAAVVGAAGSVYASGKAGDAAEDAGRIAELQPFGVQTPFGAANIDKGTLNVDAGAGAALAGGFEQTAQNALNVAQDTPIQQGLNVNSQDVLQQALGTGQGAVGAFNNTGAQFLQGSQNLLQQLQGFDQQGFASNRLNQLNELAAPGEQNAANSLANRLFSQGRVGGEDTRAGRAFGELSQAQGRAQTERGILSQQAASSEFQQMIQNSGALAGFAGQAGQAGLDIQGQGIQNLGGALNTGFGAQQGNLGFLQQLLQTGDQGATGIQNAFAPTRSAIQTLLAGSELQQGGAATASQAIQQGGQTQANLIGNVTGGIVQGLGSIGARQRGDG